MHRSDITISGGAGSTTANLEQLDQAARSLERLAEQLSQCGRQAQMAAGRLNSSAVHAPHTAAAVSQAFTTLAQHPPASFASLQQRSQDLAARLRTARRHYTEAESEAKLRALDSADYIAALTDRLAPLGRSAQAMAQRLLTELWQLILTYLASGELPRDVAGRMDELMAKLARTIGPGNADVLFMQLIGAIPKHTTPGGITAFFAGRTIDAFARDEVSVLHKGKTTTGWWNGVTIADLARQTGIGHTASDPDADGRYHVRVNKVLEADGTVRGWVVSFPGMSLDGDGDPNHPVDLEAVVRAAAGDPTAVEKELPNMLREAGAQPGEPIVLAGHSGGGLIAMSWANSPSAKDYKVAGGVTFGSPTGLLRTPPTGQYLHVENRGDFVVGLEGADNEIAPNRTTVRFFGTYQPEPSPGTNPGELGNLPRLLGHQHEVSAYEQTARLVDARSGDASVREFRATLDQVVPPEPVQVVTTDFVVESIEAPRLECPVEAVPAEPSSEPQRRHRAGRITPPASVGGR